MLQSHRRHNSRRWRRLLGLRIRRMPSKVHQKKKKKPRKMKRNRRVQSKVRRSKSPSSKKANNKRSQLLLQVIQLCRICLKWTSEWVKLSKFGQIQILISFITRRLIWEMERYVLLQVDFRKMSQLNR